MAVTAAIPFSAQAFCGFYAGKADASLFNEASQVVIVRDGNRTVLSMLNDYSGPLSEFALVVPTPTALQKGQVRVAEKATFERLDAYSSPRLAEYHDSDPCRMNFYWGEDVFPRPLAAPMAAAVGAMRGATAKSRDAALGVTVEAAYTLEEYDIVSLSAKQSDGLETWLTENGYKIPKGASAALKPYINMGMKFFVAKVNLKEQQRLGYSMLRPLQFAFESEKFMLPMRLGMLNAPPDKPQDLIVYVLTKNGRVESSNYRTVKLAANENLPPFIKPRFKEFYKALYDSSSQREDYKVVFTEYFWDMGWCDPCAANPLTTEELRKAGVFWVGGDEASNFRQLQSAPAVGAPGSAGKVTVPVMPPRPPGFIPGGGAQPVMLTRLHVRYTANTFPEDLMFTQTRDKQNFQTRYVVQNPYAGSVAQCSDAVAKTDCESTCNMRLSNLQRLLAESRKNGWGRSERYENKSADDLASECTRACRDSKASALEAATRYYQRELPERLAREKQTLAKLTGWSMADIDGMAPRSGPAAGGGDVQPVPATDNRTWWQKLFGALPAHRRSQG
ncbi:MAG: DUF2330 domain-containing protein [Burkholderiales bacterium]|nr:DUF2330 domain-containing protein [Burkholderiales bacterium]